MIKRSKSDPELRPDAWERFERAVDAAVKSGPKHRAVKTVKKAKKRPKRKPKKS